MYSMMFSFVLLALELFGFLVYAVVDIGDLYDHRAGVLDRLDEEAFLSFVERSADPILGWRVTGPSTHQSNDCEGTPRTYTVDSTGARVYEGYDRKAAPIVVVGDSYTQGYEGDDDHTYPAQLAKILGVSVANHGVGGYGPVQSFLNSQAVVPLYPQAKVVILGIMYENLYRMLNSYRPVLYEKAMDYGLKPYMADGDIQPHPGADAFASVDSFRGYAVDAFENDFWAKPDSSFPFSVALFRAVGTNYFLFRKFQKQFRRLGVPEYFLAFSQQRVTTQLLRLIGEFADYAVMAGVQPVLVFIPRNRYDTNSATTFLDAHRAELNSALIIGDVGDADVDWSRFNLEEPNSDNICHPSPYGYRVIAEYVSALLRRNNIALHQG